MTDKLMSAAQRADALARDLVAAEAELADEVASQGNGAKSRYEVLRAKQRSEEVSRAAMKVLNAWAAVRCPLALGEIVPCAGARHTGKRFRVDRVFWEINPEVSDRHPKRHLWCVEGTIMRMDNSEGLRHASFTELDWEERGPEGRNPQV